MKIGFSFSALNSAYLLPLSAVLLGLSLLLLPSSIASQELIGEIDIEEEASKASPYRVSQDDAIDYFQDINSLLWGNK